MNGLSGSGLVLRNGSESLSVAAGATSFAFPTAVAQGQPYQVTVAQQPTNPWQTCTVSAGAGTMGSANVTNVAVSCAVNTYAIGGTVAGLAEGETLVLRNSGGDDLTVAANGAFTFATSVASGGAYAVTVLEKPAAKTCTVGSGSGTVAGAAITSVTVTCSTDSFAVGGTVTGLAAGGTLVLQNNGGDDESIGANGAFTFATPVASGAPYAVTILTQPANQTCSVASGSGTVGTSAVTNVAVTCEVNTFFVGGVVHGLVGTGLVLHADIGAGEDLPVAANATTFTFVNKAPFGAIVNVTVSGQPAAPAETCTVAESPVTVGAADVNTLVVDCTTAIQRWQAPTTWGGLWPDSGTMVQHAYFDGAQIVETKGVTWAVQNGTLPAQREFKGFPSGTRWGAGPFEGPRYQASDGDAGFDFPGDMLVCAVVKPDFNPVVDGQEHVIIAKGAQNQGGTALIGAGWALVQKHHMFNFLYRYNDGLNNFAGNAYTPTFFADASEPDNGPLNPSYVVVCGGRDGDTLVAAANNVVDGRLFRQTLPSADVTLRPGATPHRLTIGGYDDSSAAHDFGGRVYETAIWNEPATTANIQAKFDAILGVPSGARYVRNREGPFTGPDGQHHTAWRHAPRFYGPDAARGFGGGLLFGLQGRNRLTRPYTPPASDVVSQLNPVIAYGEALDLWTGAGGAAVVKDQLVPPGDSEQAGAEHVTLPAGASLSTPLDVFDSAGPIHGMLWIQPVSTTGTLRVRTTRPSGATSQHDIDLATLPAGEWTRRWLTGLTNDGSATPATVFLENNGGSPIEFYAWGVDLTQLGRGGDLGSFDPGLEMYDWTGTADDDEFLLDVLRLPNVPSSTAETGFCLTVEAQPPAGLSWTAPFVADRSPLTWVSDSTPANVVNIFVSGTTNPVIPDQNVCAFVSSAGSAVCFAPTWDPGSQHTLTVCAATDGNVTFHADGAQVGPTRAGAAPFDLATGRVLVGNNAFGTSATAAWQGFVTKVAVCPAGNPGACR